MKMREFFKVVLLLIAIIIFHESGGALGVGFVKIDAEGKELGNPLGVAVYSNYTIHPDNSTTTDTITTSKFSIATTSIKDLRDFCIYRFCEMCRENMSDPELDAIVFLDSFEVSLENFKNPDAQDINDYDDDDDNDDEDDEEDDEEENLLELMPFSYYPLYENCNVRALIDSKKILIGTSTNSLYGLNLYSVSIIALVPVSYEVSTYLRVKKLYHFVPQIHYHEKGNGAKESEFLWNLWEREFELGLLDEEGYEFIIHSYFHFAPWEVYNFPITEITFNESNIPHTIEDLFKPIPGEIIRTDLEFNPTWDNEE